MASEFFNLKKFVSRSMVAFVLAMILMSLLAEPVGKWIGLKLSGYDAAKAKAIDKKILERERAERN